jgi:hypothetical protein
LWTLLICAAAAPAEELRGVIAKVDFDTHQLVIEGRGRGMRRGVYTFSLAKNSLIMVGRKPADPANLQPGQRVRVFYEMDNDRRVIAAIHIRGGRVIKGEDRGIAGTVRTFLPRERKLVIQTRGPEGMKNMTLELAPKFTVTADGQTVEASELKKGVHVRVVPENQDGKMVVNTIQLVEEEPGFISKMRQALKVADLLLQMAEKQK